MAKQTKITIVLEQPLHGEHTETVVRSILGDINAFGAYVSFSQDRVTIEEVETNPVYFPACRDAGKCTGICVMCYDLLSERDY